ncbi:unnamed protein product [Euphydryas editha]|uniref:Uncharacterized protein n=1 Tax=Euphydryas editha TaxID=104508 RepID=A0AAU9TI74_EUPED|nr:unnamed protein product [Euphydryas editha]
MDDLIEAQMNLHNQMYKAKINYGKYPKERITQFCENHYHIIELSQKADEPYFEDDLMEIVDKTELK